MSNQKKLMSIIVFICFSISACNHLNKTDFSTNNPANSASTNSLYTTELISDIGITSAEPVSLNTITPENISKLNIVDRWGKGNLHGITLSPDESMLAIATDTGIYIYRLPDLKQIKYLDILFQADYQNGSNLDNILTFNPNGTQLAILNGNIIYFWDIKQNIETSKTFASKDSCPPIEIAFSPNGRTLVMVGRGSCQNPGTRGINYALFDVMSDEIIYQHSFTTDPYISFFYRFIKDHRIAFVEEQNKLKIVDTENGALLYSNQYTGTITSISEDGKSLGISGWDENWIINTKTSDIISQTDKPVYFLSDPAMQILADYDLVSLTDKNNQPICDFPTTFNPRLPDEIAFNSRIAGKYFVFWNENTQYLEIWDIYQCRLVKKVTLPVFQYPIEIGTSSEIMAVSSGYNINILDVENRQLLSSVPFHTNTYSDHAYRITNDEKSIVFHDKSNKNQIRIFSLHDFQETGKFIIPDKVYDVNISPSGNYVLIDSGSSLDVWNIKNEELVYSLQNDKTSHFISPNDKQLALFTNNSLFFYHLENGHLENQINFPNNVNSIAFADDWSMFFVVTDTSGEIWNSDGTKMTTLWQYSVFEYNDQIGDIDKQISNESQLIYSAVFSPDNKLLAFIKSINYETQIIEIWDLSTGEKCHEITNTGHTQIRFSPDGKKLFSIINSAIYVWGVREE